MPINPATGPFVPQPFPEDEPAAPGQDESMRWFWLYEPFARSTPGGYRTFVVYVYRADGSRKRAGAVDLRGRDGEALVEFWRAAGGRIVDREELGLPASIVSFTEPRKSSGTA